MCFIARNEIEMLASICVWRCEMWLKKCGGQTLQNCHRSGTMQCLQVNWNFLASHASQVTKRMLLHLIFCGALSAKSLKTFEAHRVFFACIILFIEPSWMFDNEHSIMNQQTNKNHLNSNAKEAVAKGATFTDQKEFEPSKNQLERKSSSSECISLSFHNKRINCIDFLLHIQIMRLCWVFIEGIRILVVQFGDTRCLKQTTSTNKHKIERKSHV